METENKDQEEDWGFQGNALEVRIARALYGSRVKIVREYVASLDLPAERTKMVLARALSESDRSAAVLIFAYIEDLMLEAIKRNCNPDVSGGWEEVTGGNGLLATANDRITFLHLLHWIKPNTYSDLRLLKSIRNRFAHHSDVSSFSDDRIRSWIGALSPAKNEDLSGMREAIPGLPEKLSTRHTYLLRVTTVLMGLVEELALGPQSRAHRIDPTFVERLDFDFLPENRQKLQMACAEFAVSLFKASIAETKESSP